jgi:hypothetical protein
MITIPKTVRLALKLASDIIPKLPAKDDTLLQVSVKMLGVIDSAQGILFPTTRGNILDTIIDRYDLEEAKNEQFVSLFFDTDLYEQFKVHRFSLTDYMDVIDASHETYGRLFFIEYTYSSGGPESTFYHSKGMEFSEILDGLWESHEGRLHVSVGVGEHGSGTKSEFTEFTEWPNPLFGSMQDLMAKHVARHQRLMADKIPRSYMFYGPPGTGKSSFAIQFASRLGSRTLKMDAQSFTHVTLKDVAFLLTNLKPDFLVLDDVDKADVSKGLPTILEILQRFKSDHALSVLLTANTITQFDLGFLRPGRIDTWVEFPLPEENERRDVIRCYVEQFKAHHVTAEQIAHLAKITSNLSQDYLREVAQLLCYDEIEEVTKTISTMQKLLAASTANSPPATNVKGPTPNG